MACFLVVGDFMTDRYLHVTLRGKSPEQADCDVWTVFSEEEFDGGAGNVVANLYALGQGVLALASPGQRPIKTRVMLEGKQIARLDQHDKCNPINLDHLAFDLNQELDGVIVSDYAKGSINDNVRRMIMDAHLPTFVDSKGSPELWDGCGDVWFFPNSVEFAQHEAGYRKASQVIYKCGSEGLARLSYGDIVERYPAFTPPHMVIDVCGAGDTVIAAFATQLIDQPTLFSPTLFANAAAATVVAKPNTSTTSIVEIVKFVHTQV